MRAGRIRGNRTGGRRALLRGALALALLALLAPLGVAVAPSARADMASQVASAAQYAAGRGQVGISVLDRLTGQVYENGALAHTQMRSASIPKLFVAESLLSRARTGAITLTAHDRALLETMIMRSDDAAMSSLYSRFGGLQMVSNVMVKYGLSEIGGPPTPSYWGMYRITAHDIVKFYAGMLGGGLQPADRDYLVGLMRKATPYGSDGFDQFFGIPRALPGQAWGIKQGWMCCQESRRWLHTSGILGSDNRFLVAVLSSTPHSRSYAYAGETLTGTVQRLFPGGQIPSGASLSNPRGDVNRITEVAPGTVRVEGWTFDPDDPTRSLQVHVYVDGRYRRASSAALSRSDVAAAYPAAGPAHGYRVDVAVPDGRHQVCTYAINVGAGDRNPSLGCHTVTVQLGPVGSLDAVATAGVRTVRIAGWTLDREVPTQSLQVNLQVDGRAAGQVAAGAARADVGRAYPGAGAAHGFSADLALTAGGTHRVCAYGVNVGSGGTDTLLGCRSVALPTGVRGSLDRVNAVATGQYDLVGWALDTDARTTSIPVHVYVDGKWRAASTAAISRSDLVSSFPDAGRLHGYSVRVRLAPGSHNVCVYAIRATAGGTNPLLGCRTLAG
jgi:hypothetical protein